MKGRKHRLVIEVTELEEGERTATVVLEGTTDILGNALSVFAEKDSRAKEMLSIAIESLGRHKGATSKVIYDEDQKI